MVTLQLIHRSGRRDAVPTLFVFDPLYSAADSFRPSPNITPHQNTGHPSQPTTTQLVGAGDGRLTPLQLRGQTDYYDSDTTVLQSSESGAPRLQRRSWELSRDLGRHPVIQSSRAPNSPDCRFGDAWETHPYRALPPCLLIRTKS